jgi:hypothetical protein
MQYVKPRIVDLGSIAAHTFTNWPPKGGGDPQHLDKFCEWSGGTAPDDPRCV